MMDRDEKFFYRLGLAVYVAFFAFIISSMIGSTVRAFISFYSTP